MFGFVYEWFYSYVLGVWFLIDVYCIWRFKLCFKGEFDFVEGKVDLFYGLIIVQFDWRDCKDGSVIVDVIVFVGIFCEFFLLGDSSVVKIQWQFVMEV